MTLKLSTGLRNKLLGINPEKVTAGDMETDGAVQAAWTEVAATMLGGVSFDSQNTMSLTGADGYASQAISVKEGHWYRLSYKWGKTGTTDSAEVKIGTAADDGTYYASSLGTGAQATLATVGAGESVADAITIQIPAGVSSVTITLGISGATDTAYFDDVSFVSMGRSIQDIFEYGQIKIYTGLQPTSADDAPTGTLLVTIDNSGTGLTFNDASSGAMTKASGETWTGTCVATGTAGWARLMTSTDGGASSTTDERIDMSVGTSGAQINLSSTAFSSGASQTLTSFTVTLPAS